MGGKIKKSKALIFSHIYTMGSATLQWKLTKSFNCCECHVDKILEEFVTFTGFKISALFPEHFCTFDFSQVFAAGILELSCFSATECLIKLPFEISKINLPFKKTLI